MRYIPLLQITAAHGYYADGLCRGMHFTPGAATSAWLREVGGLCRQSGAELLVLGDRATAAAAQPIPQGLSWTLTCDDPQFASVTAGLPAARDEVLVCACVRALSAPAQGDAWRLHAGPTAGDAQAWPLRWPAVAALLTAPQRRSPPLALLQVPQPRPGPNDRPDGGPDGGPDRYVCTFAARAPIWKYCLVGAWSADRLAVVAAMGEPTFGDPVAEQLDNGQPVLAFRSSVGIELRERSDRRFQLRARTAAADRVLVKRLPVAGADHFARETIHGVPTLVSEIYVHR